MIRIRNVDPARLDAWLSEKPGASSGGAYKFRLLDEELPGRTVIWAELVAYVSEAHEDAKLKVRKALEPTLAPFTTPLADPAFGYPQDLNATTLMGYFGEVLAGLIVEHKSIHNRKEWRIPAFLFRFHQVAFQKLQARRDLLHQNATPGPVDASKAIIPGRTGNDLLAFLTAPDGEVGAILVCEAKCFASHNAAKATVAHKQLAEFCQTRCPTGIAELIEILNDYDSPEATEWCERLRHFYFDVNVRVDRFNVLSYATGNAPKIPKTRKSWLSSSQPDAEYTAKQPLEVIEVHLSDPTTLVKSLYR